MGRKNMVFGLFGGDDQLTELRSSLSKEAFMAELEKTVKTFGIASTEAPGKSETYGVIEAVARFIFEQVMKTAVSAKTMTTEKDLDAAATFCIVLVQCLGRNADLSKSDCRILQGTVPGFVFPRTLGDELRQKTSVALSKAVMRYVHQLKQKKFRKHVEAVEDNITQFLTHRKPDYYSTLAIDIGRFI